MRRKSSSSVNLSNRLIITDRTGKILKEIPTAIGKEAIFRPNDCISDGMGGVYITAPGHFAKSEQLMGKLFYLKASGEVILIKDKLTYPNGIAISGNSFIPERTFKRPHSEIQHQSARAFGPGDAICQTAPTSTAAQ